MQQDLATLAEALSGKFLQVALIRIKCLRAIALAILTAGAIACPLSMDHGQEQVFPLWEMIVTRMGKGKSSQVFMGVHENAAAGGTVRHRAKVSNV
ncbi:hypothetical protein RvVAT039_22950 [Agrobacterium vitis]|uniref:hypothetical protein n=1 Tax=Agrobacterium vitis TaxID=373 RepID=UPI0012E7A445|nr:hypothetical protein [Agrobacterium vitis]MVA52396.1 hypothetical protein [Agrobacterium vitis]NSZ51900.1 hypothetical protein [Agrobacterium vitis]NTA30659.1 hypothetical protein [Agrobacterium vitis]BCH65079.1 hypothetical protein RvVAT039_22950 [Agrobacterium vitis]